MDSSVFTGGIPALKYDQQLQVVFDNVPLKFNELYLELSEFCFIGWLFLR